MITSRTYTISPPTASGYHTVRRNGRVISSFKSREAAEAVVAQQKNLDRINDERRAREGK
jgi:hypothetical protein